MLLGPHISEKSTLAGEASNSYTFKVVPDATKPEIKAAVEQIFEVRVESVNTMNVKGKVKRTMRGTSRRKNWKKAIVRLAEGQAIDFAPAE